MPRPAATRTSTASFRLDAATVAILDAIAARSGVSKSDVIRLAIRAYHATEPFVVRERPDLPGSKRTPSKRKVGP